MYLFHLHSRNFLEYIQKVTTTASRFCFFPVYSEESLMPPYLIQGNMWLVAHYFSVTPFWEGAEWLRAQEFTCASCTAMMGWINNTQVLYWYAFGAILIPIFSEHHLLIVSLCQEAIWSLRSLSEYLHIWKQETAVLTQPRVPCLQDVTSHLSPASCMLWQWGRNI